MFLLLAIWLFTCIIIKLYNIREVSNALLLLFEIFLQSSFYLTLISTLQDKSSELQGCITQIDLL
jgi:hypothetical protein